QPERSSREPGRRSGMTTETPTVPPAPERAAPAAPSAGCCADAAVRASEAPGQLRREAAFVAVALAGLLPGLIADWMGAPAWLRWLDRKSTRLNSSHVKISYAVFCLKKKKKLEHH